MYPNNTLYVPPVYNSGYDFFQTLRCYVKFSLVLLFFVTLILILLWNWQPWFEIEIKPVNKVAKAKTASLDYERSGRMLQSHVELIDYVVRPGDTLSEIAERYGIGLSVLMKHNGITNPHSIRSGQRLRIPQ
jgi:hypothetical protein